MMRVRLTVSRASEYGAWRPGQVIEVPESEALALERSAQAIILSDDPLEATADICVEETVVKRRRGRPRKKVVG